MPELPPPLPQTGPLALRPLTGLTLLLVEDSRFASDAVRLMSLRSGARLRRADCLAAAERHLRVYTPDVILIDLGLPDGRGEDLIQKLAKATPRIPAILAISGEDYGAPRATAAGADGYLAKPVDTLVGFQKAILNHLPPNQAGRTIDAQDLTIRPDPLALRDDLRRAAEILDQPEDTRAALYVGQFLRGVARTACDKPLEKAATALGQPRFNRKNQRNLSRLIEHRIAGSRTV